MRNEAARLGEEDDPPLPPRYWWLKRLGVGFVLFIAALWGLSLWAGHVVQRRLDREIAALRAKGELMAFEDFVGPAVEDWNNAAVLLDLAGGALDIGKQDSSAFYDLADKKPPFSPPDMRLLDDLMTRNAGTLELLREARGRAGVNWHPDRKSQGLSGPLYWNGCHEEGYLLLLAARWAHQRGDDAAAIEYLRDVVFVAQAVEKATSVGAHWYACSMFKGAADEAGRIALQATPAIAGPMRALLGDLLDERVMREGLVRAVQAERWRQLEWVQMIADGGASQIMHFFKLNISTEERAFLDYGPRWLLLQEAWSVLPYDAKMVEAAREPDLPAAMATKLPPAPGRPGGPVATLAGLLLPPLNQVAGRHYSSLNARRQAAIALAARLYELDHGRKPQRVEDLVPQYLPTCLQDPITGGGALLGLPATRPANGSPSGAVE